MARKKKKIETEVVAEEAIESAAETDTEEAQISEEDLENSGLSD